MPENNYKIKPIMGVEKEERLDKVFYRQFSSHYELLKNNNNDFNSLVLAGLFLPLTLESYINWVIRWLLKGVNVSKNRRLIRVWYNHFETAKLREKIQFFKDAFLDEIDSPELNKIKENLGSLSELRNLIVHGHDFTITQWSNYETDKTKLAELLTSQKINDYHDKFKECMELFPVLIKQINMEELIPGIPSKEYIVEYLTFKVEE